MMKLKNRWQSTVGGLILRCDVLAAIAIVLIMLSAGSARAQLKPPATSEPRSIPKLIVFSNNGPTPAPAPPARQARRRGSNSSLDLAGTRAAVKAATGKDVTSSNQYATVTAIQPFVADRAYLAVWGKSSYFPMPLAGEGVKGGLITVFPSGAITIHLKPAASQTYLIDVEVVANGEVTTYGPGGQTITTFAEGADWPQHILVLLNATDTQWKEITIMPKLVMDFLSCKVTTLQ